MKWLLATAAAMGLALATPALAAPPDHSPDKHQTRSHKAAQQQQHKAAPAPAPMQQTKPAHKPAPHRAAQQNKNRFDWNRYQPGRTPPYMKREPRIDMHAWHRNFRAEKRYHWRPYNKPRGWYYRRWAFGMIFPVIFWQRDYWITDYWNFGLPNPPYGYVWVRYGDDAVLVNVRTGYILQIVYSLFD